MRKQIQYIEGEGGRVTRISPAKVWLSSPNGCFTREGFRVDYIECHERFYRSMKGTHSRCVASAAYKADTGINDPIPIDVAEGNRADKPIDDDDQPRWSRKRQAMRNSRDKRKRLTDRRKARKYAGR